MTHSYFTGSPGAQHWLWRMPAEARLLVWHGLAMFGFFAICFFLQFTDNDVYNGASIWLKPTKFFGSFGLHALTVAAAIAWTAGRVVDVPKLRGATFILLATMWFELVYITFRASQGQPSHFDIQSGVGIALFAAMAVAAVTLVGITAYIGFLVWRTDRTRLMNQAIFVGFTISAVLTTIVGLSIGENLGPWVGGVASNSGGLPIVSWSTTGGDLRVSHFVATHIAQAVPIAALMMRPNFVWAVAGLGGVATIATFLQAMAGLPLIAL